MTSVPAELGPAGSAGVRHWHDHPKLDPIRAGDLLTSWVAHDHIHVRQLNRILRDLMVSSAPGFSRGYAGRW